MKERPILFSAPMVKALLAGRKTQTRRIAKFTPAGHLKELDGHRRWHPDDPEATLACPYGRPGDRLWVRETCSAYEVPDPPEGSEFAEQHGYDPEFPPCGLDGVIYKADGAFREIENSPEAGAAWHKLYTYRGKKGATVPPIHMPRWASRITLEVTEVRVQRLQIISEADAVAEGLTDDECFQGAVPAYAALWERINGTGSWEANPYVWAVSFKVTTPRAVE